MLRLRLVLCAVLIAGVAAPSVQAAAATALSLYVANSEQASDANGCTVVAPCATLQRAADVAGSSAAVIHVGAGGYRQTTVAEGQQLSIVGAGAENTELYEPINEPALINSGDLTLSGVSVEADYGVIQHSGTLALRGVRITSRIAGITAQGGTTDIVSGEVASTSTSSTAVHVGEAAIVRAVHVVFAGAAGIDVAGGSFTGDDVFMGGPRPVDVDAGDVTLTRSTIDGGRPGIAVSGTAHADVTDSSFVDNGPAVRVTAGSATLVADTVDADESPQLERTGGNLLMAATVIGQQTRGACDGVVVDGGYNLSPDATCGFTDPHSAVRPSGVGVHLVAPATGVSSSLAPDATSDALDAIPVGALASFDPTRELCAVGATSQTGTARPALGRCDIGAVEAAPVHITAELDRARTTYGSRVVLTGSVRGADGRIPQGRVAFTYAGTPTTPKGCGRPIVTSTGTFRCVFGGLQPVVYHFSASFVPDDASHPARAADDLRLVVDRPPTTLAVSLRGTRVHSHPAIAVAVRARSSSDLAVPGSVGFAVQGHQAAGCPSLRLVDGRGSCTIRAPRAGANKVLAHYRGSYYFAPVSVRRTVTVPGR